MKYVYDVETFKNFFSAIFINPSDLDDGFVVEISKYKNNVNELIEFVNGKMLIGYNNSMFDDIILNGILHVGKSITAEKIYELAQIIISSQRHGAPKNILWIKEPTRTLLKYKKPYKSVDLMKLLAFDKQKIGLKHVSVNLRHERLQDLPYPHDHIVQENQIEEILDYNMNDVIITIKLLEKCIPELKMRRDIGEIFKINVMDSSNSIIADKLMSKFYSQATGLDWKEFKDQRTERESISFKDIISDKIEFTTPQMQKFLNQLKEIEI